jgi:hypothetical protein
MSPRLTLPRITISPTLSVISVLAFVAGLALLAMMVIWGDPMSEAAAAEQRGDLAGALEKYSVVEQRFDRLLATKQVLPGAYRASIANQLRLRYQMQEYDAVVEKAALAPSTAAIHFWAGCALFEKGRPEQAREERVTWLNRAGDEFRKSLERDPENWDAKYNYELTQLLLGELQEEEGEPQKLLPKLIERPAPMGPTRRIG